MREVTTADEVTAPPPVPRRGGLPVSAALVAMVVVSVGACVLDLRAHEHLGLPSRIAFVAVCVLAALVARRRGLFSVVVVPPLVLILAVAVGVLVHRGVGGGTTAVGLAIATELLPQFPVMAGTTAATVVIGLIRYLTGRK